MKAVAKLRVHRLHHRPPPANRVAIVVPLGTRPMDDDERTSLRHLRHFLGGYDTFILAHKGMDVSPFYEPIRYFDARYFGSADAHASLQLSPVFFEAFADYQYILMYQLDCLVFSDQLEHWCDRGWDYIGAPWFPGPQTPWVEEPRVGNSGFALFNVRRCLEVLYSPRYALNPLEYIKSRYGQGTSMTRKVRDTPRVVARCLHAFNGVRWRIDHWLEKHRPSDLFWSYHAKTFLPDFRLATVEDGLEFAFETEPRACFERNGRKLPFGCHAWTKYDRSFWEPYVLPKPASANAMAMAGVNGK